MKDNFRNRKQTILIADDSEINRSLLADMLGNEFEILEAEDGQQAVAALQREGGKIDLVLLDIVMPNMDGLQALKKIREDDPNAKVVMCTAMGQEGMVVDAIKSGAKDFIVKPFNAERIVQTVQTILGN